MWESIKLQEHIRKEHDYLETKRKREEVSIIPSKKKKGDDLICDVRMSKFTRKDNLKCHISRKH